MKEVIGFDKDNRLWLPLFSKGDVVFQLYVVRELVKKRKQFKHYDGREEDEFCEWIDLYEHLNWKIPEETILSLLDYMGPQITMKNENLPTCFVLSTNNI